MFYRFDAMFIPVIYVLRTYRDYLFEYFLRFHTRSCDFCAVNMSWLLVWMFYRFDAMFILVIYVLQTYRDYLFECLPLLYKNVIKTYFAMKTLKRVNMVMWAL